MNKGNNDNGEFIEQVRRRAARKVEEYHQLLHEQGRIGVQLERAKIYVGQLNSLLEGEGQSPIPLREPKQGAGVGKIGNRAKDFPVRKPEWAGMTLDEIVKTILELSPIEIYHADVIAHKIYEIQSEVDLRRVKMSLVSILRKGAQRGLWESKRRNRYSAKVGVQVRAKLVSA
ncbi:MAG: hypothetical protein MUP49_00645 [Dehalococcoidia bacterium]|nr:hypothetical protein [Dehalococcoidia bacterium]